MTEDVVAMTVESDGKGGLYPVRVRAARRRPRGARRCPAEPLLDFATPSAPGRRSARRSGASCTGAAAALTLSAD